MSVKASSLEWVKIVKKYQKPESWKAIWQVVNTFIPYVVLWFFMFKAYQISYWVMLPLAIIAAGLQIRLFIFQHDCGHNSFFPNKNANNILGGLLGIITLTPYAYWRKTHAVHHATSGDLDFRGLGDVDTITVSEYLAKDWKGKFWYRFYRHPLVMFGIGPIFVYFIRYRYPFDIPTTWTRERNSVFRTNFGILAAVAIMWALVGIKAFVAIYVTTIIIAISLGVWLFYV
ncbi:MAG: fatty acid desaturase, partial [Chloroflexota bacterium]